MHPSTGSDGSEDARRLGMRSRHGFPDSLQARARALATSLRIFAIPQIGLAVCLFMGTAPQSLGDDDALSLPGSSRPLVACLVAAHALLSLLAAHVLPRADDGGDVARAQLRRAFSRLRWLAIVDAGFVVWLLWRNASTQVLS